MIRRAAMAIWEHEHSKGQNVPAANVKFPNQYSNGITTLQDIEKT
jgi:hypothetical protein